MKCAGFFLCLIIVGISYLSQAADVAFLEKKPIALCANPADCMAIEVRGSLNNKPMKLFAAKCSITHCSVRILFLNDLALSKSIKEVLQSNATETSLFISTAGFRDRIGDRLVPDGLLISGHKLIQSLVPKVSHLNGKLIHTGGVFYVTENQKLSIDRYSDFSERVNLESIPFANQSPTILIYQGKSDFGLNSTDYSDRSAVGISIRGDFMFFLALSLNEKPDLRPRYDAVTLQQFADVVLRLSEEMNDPVTSAVNMEGYSYPFALLPRRSYTIGRDEKKLMPSIFVLEELSK